MKVAGDIDLAAVEDSLHADPAQFVATMLASYIEPTPTFYNLTLNGVPSNASLPFVWGTGEQKYETLIGVLAYQTQQTMFLSKIYVVANSTEVLNFGIVSIPMTGGSGLAKARAFVTNIEISTVNIIPLNELKKNDFFEY